MNGIEVRMNKEIMDYKEALFMGLSLRQLLFSILFWGRRASPGCALRVRRRLHCWGSSGLMA